MYEDSYSEVLVKKLVKLKKKNPSLAFTLQKKMQSILEYPEHSYKFLHHTMKGLNKVHIGHFVLVFGIDHVKKKVSFEDFAHHDEIYS